MCKSISLTYGYILRVNLLLKENVRRLQKTARAGTQYLPLTNAANKTINHPNSSRPLISTETIPKRMEYSACSSPRGRMDVVSCC